MRISSCFFSFAGYFEISLCVAGVFSADSSGAEGDTDGGEFDVRESGDGLVAERRMCGRVVRRGAAGDGNVRLAHGREQRPRQRRQYLS